MALNEAELRAIHRLKKQGMSFRNIAIGYPYSYATVWRDYQKYLNEHNWFKKFLRRKK